MYTKQELEGKSFQEIRTIAKELDINTFHMKKVGIIEKILESQLELDKMDVMPEAEMTPREEEELMEAVRLIALELDSGKEARSIINELAVQGLDRDKAEELVLAIKEDLGKDKKLKQGEIDDMAERLLQGKEPGDIVNELIEKGLEPERAKDIVEGVKSEVDEVIREERAIEQLVYEGLKYGKNLEEIMENLSEKGYDLEEIRPLVEEIYEILKP